MELVCSDALKIILVVVSRIEFGLCNFQVIKNVKKKIKQAHIQFFLNVLFIQ